MKYILGIVALSFILTIVFSWGMGGFKDRGYKAEQGVIGVVNGQKIQYQDFIAMVENQYARMKDQTGSDDLPEYQKKSIRDRLWNDVVQESLIREEINRLNIKATPNEVVYEIKRNPPQDFIDSEQFQKNGEFDFNAYHKILKDETYQRMFIPYERFWANQIPMRKMQQWVLSKVRVTDAEVAEAYRLEKNKVNARYAFYNPASIPLEKIDIQESEIQAYYNKHKEEYVQSEQRKIEYILLEPKMTKEDSLRIDEDAEYILNELKAGADFAELAEEYSKDSGSKSKGGDLGFFGRGEMVKPFEEAAFSTHVGDVVGPVESPFGLHIIKVVARKVEKGELKVQASHILLKYEVGQENYDRINDQAEYIYEQLEKKKGKEFVSIAEQEKLELKTSEWISREGMIPGVGMAPRVNFYIFSEKKGWASPPMHAGKNVIIFRIIDISKEHTQSLDEVKEDIQSKIQAEKRLESAKNQCQLAWQKINRGLTLEEAAAEDSITVFNTNLFNLNGYINRIGRDVQFAGAAFKLDVHEISEPVEGQRGFYLIQVIEKQEADLTEFESVKESRKQDLFKKKQQEYFTAWIEKLKSQADIEDYRIQYF